MFGVIKNNTKFKHTANQLVSDFLIQLYFFEVKVKHKFYPENIC